MYFFSSLRRGDQSTVFCIIFPVEERFNKPGNLRSGVFLFLKLGHELDDMEARCVKQCRDANNSRHRDGMRLIFHLGFHFSNSLMRARFHRLLFTTVEFNAQRSRN